MTWAALDRKREVAAAAFLLAMTVSHVVMVAGVWPLLRSGYQDFTIFYTGGEMVRSGHTKNLYDLSAQYQAQQQFAPDVQIRRGALPYNHPPFEALLFVPLAMAGYFPAYLVWTILNLLLLMASLALLRLQFPEVRQLSPGLLALAAAGFFPIAVAVMQGQDSVALLLIVVSALVLLDRSHDVRAGMVLALGLFKFHLIIPMVLLLALGRRRILIGFMPVATLLAGLSFVMMGWNGTAGYIRFLLRLEAVGGGGAIVSQDMPNLHGLVACLPWAGAHPDASAMLTAGLSTGVFLLAAATIRNSNESISWVFVVAALASVLVSYHLLAYDFSLLLPGAVLLFCGVIGTERERFMHSILLPALFLTPLYVFLWFYLGMLGWYALVLLAIFFVLIRDRAKVRKMVQAT